MEPYSVPREANRLREPERRKRTLTEVIIGPPRDVRDPGIFHRFR